MKPFLKWTGGKYKIIDRIIKEIPKGKVLIEPFAGSGAVFLNANYDGYLISDANSDLINLYKIIKEEGGEFIEYASSFFASGNNNEKTYYLFRDEFNNSVDMYKKSAIFIYLNHHCFNGLCRYNSRGCFNVAFGRYAKPNFPKKEMLNFYERSKRAIFQIADFKDAMIRATSGSVIYCDPPYVPLRLQSGFKGYTPNGFLIKDHEDLADNARELSLNGIPVIISNHDTEFTRFIYRGAKITSFDVQRFISCKAEKRDKAPELIASYLT